VKPIIIFLPLVFLLSCEVHKQSSFSKGSEDQGVFNLGIIEQMFASISKDAYFELSKTLDKQTIDLNTRNKNGQTLLNEAVKLKRILITKLLIDKGADPTEPDKQDFTAFDLIKEFEQKGSWKRVLDGEDFERSFLNTSVVKLVEDSAMDNQNSAIKKLDIFFEYGAEPNARNARKYTLLMIAASKGLPALVHYFCQKEDVDLNAKVKRLTVLKLVKRLARRDQSLKPIIGILKSYGAK
jgi:ankyrin repeat protein